MHYNIHVEDMNGRIINSTQRTNNNSNNSNMVKTNKSLTFIMISSRKLYVYNLNIIYDQLFCKLLYSPLLSCPYLSSYIFCFHLIVWCIFILCVFIIIIIIVPRPQYNYFSMFNGIIRWAMLCFLCYDAGELIIVSYCPMYCRFFELLCYSCSYAFNYRSPKSVSK